MFRGANFLIYFAAALVFFAFADVFANECAGPNESNHICGGMCAPTCEDPEPNPMFCPRIVCRWNFTSGCRCNEGFVKDTDAKACVLYDDCKSKKET